MARLTDAQRKILFAASQRDDGGVELPDNVQGNTAAKVLNKLIRVGLLEEVCASASLPVWRRNDESGAIALRITSAGLAAIESENEAMPLRNEDDGRLATVKVASSTPAAIASGKRISDSAATSSTSAGSRPKMPSDHDPLFPLPGSIVLIVRVLEAPQPSSARRPDHLSFTVQ